MNCFLFILLMIVGCLVAEPTSDPLNGCQLICAKSRDAPISWLDPAIHPTERLGICVPPKNACTLLKQWVARLNGRMFENNYHPPRIHSETSHFCRHCKEPFAYDFLNTGDQVKYLPWKRIFVLRDPFLRFASAFLNKRRNKNIFSHLEKHEMTLPETVEWLYSQHAKGTLDKHFLPQSEFCFVQGTLPLWTIVRLSHLREDLQTLLSRWKHDDFYKIFEELDDRDAGRHASTKDSFPEFLASLTPTLTTRILKFYEADYEFFGLPLPNISLPEPMHSPSRYRLDKKIAAIKSR